MLLETLLVSDLVFEATELLSDIVAYEGTELYGHDNMFVEMDFY